MCGPRWIVSVAAGHGLPRTSGARRLSACCCPGRHPITPVRDPAISAFQRRVRRTQRDRSVLAGRDRFATFVLHDDVMQRLYGVGLALQITLRRVDSPPVADRIDDHLHQLQDVIDAFRRPVEDPTGGPDTRRRLGYPRHRRRRPPREVATAGGRRDHPPMRVGHRDQGLDDPPRETRLVEALVKMTDSLVAGYDLAELLQYLVDTSVDLLDAAAAELVLTDRHGQLQALAATSEHTDLLEAVQIRTGRGPCMDCYTTGQPQSITDLKADVDRWPQFAPLALDQGIRSVHAVPMRDRNRTIGALNLFRTRPGELAHADRRAAQALADAATIGILRQRDAEETPELNAQLEHALAGRAVIQQAKGILAEHGQMDMDQAFTALRALAEHHHLPLTEIAADVVFQRRHPTDLLFASVPALRTPTDATSLTGAARSTVAQTPSAPLYRRET